MPAKVGQLKISQLQILTAVADYHSFSEAAFHLQLSQSAVSYAIASLEADLGVVVLARGRYGAKLTPVGEQIVERARQIIDLLDDITKQANLARGLSGGLVRISSFRSPATHILPAVIAEFSCLHPGISVSVTDRDDPLEVEADLLKGRADLGVIHLPTSSEFEVWELLQDEVIVLCPPKFRPEGGILSWQDLKAPLIMGQEGDPLDALIYAHCAQYGVTLQAAYQIRSDSTVVNMVAKGLGIAIYPKLAAEPIPPSVQVYSLPKPLFRTICVAVLANTLLTPATYTFLDLLKRSRGRH